MSNHEGESTLPFVHCQSQDLFNGKFNLQVLSVVGHGYAGQVFKCRLNRASTNNIYNNVYHSGRCDLNDDMTIAKENNTALDLDIIKQGDHYCSFSTDLLQDGDETFSSDEVQDDVQEDIEVSRDTYGEYTEETNDTDSEYTDQLIAIKIMKKVKNQPCSVENEVKLLSAVPGPNVIQYITSVECLDSYWILTEFCSGGDLHGMLKQMDDSHIMARFFLCDVLNGLECLHHQFIAHSDVKMKNILISDNNVAKLADFGFAKMYNSTTDTETESRGTRDYWAPEMGHEDSLFNPFKADIYALGVTFAGVCRKKPIKKKFDNISTIVRTFQDISQRELFNGMLHTDPEQRFYFSEIKRNTWLADGDLIDMCGT